MWWKRKYFRCSLCFLLGFIMAICMVVPSRNVMAAIPVLNAKVTQKNIMNIMKKYDSNGAYILNNAIKNGDNILFWWSPGQRITDSIETAVHEECHGYTFMNAKNSINGEVIYVGNKKGIQIKFTQIYNTKKMAKSIPKELRLQRYDTYVAKPTANLSSNINGVYGLLNEFSAYCWGMNTNVSMYDYYDNFEDTPKVWKNYLSMSGGSTQLAHMEFKYFILKYLIYAKKHYPKVYKGIVHNKAFVKAYKKTDKKFAKLVKQYNNRLKKIVKKLEKNGYQSEYTGDSFTFYDKDGGGSGYGLFLDEYKLIQKELKKNKYQKIIKALK